MGDDLDARVHALIPQRMDEQTAAVNARLAALRDAAAARPEP